MVQSPTENESRWQELEARFSQESSHYLYRRLQERAYNATDDSSDYLREQELIRRILRTRGEVFQASERSRQADHCGCHLI